MKTDIFMQHRSQTMRLVICLLDSFESQIAALSELNELLETHTGSMNEVYEIQNKDYESEHEMISKAIAVIERRRETTEEHEMEWFSMFLSEIFTTNVQKN